MIQEQFIIQMVVHMLKHILEDMQMIIDIIQHIIQIGVEQIMEEDNFLVYLEDILVDMKKKQNIKLLKLGEKKMNINIYLGKMKLVIFIIMNILLLLMLLLLVKFIQIKNQKILLIILKIHLY